MIGRKGRDLVSIPCRSSTCRTSATARTAPAASARATAKSASRSRPAAANQGDGKGQAGSDPGAAHPGSRGLAGRTGRDPRRGTGAAAHRAQGRSQHQPGKIQVQQHPPHRPRIAAALQADLHAGPAAADLLRHVRRRRAASSCRSAKTSATAPGTRCQQPRGQRRRHLHDGCLRLDDRRAEGDRPHRGLLDRHLAQEPVRRRRSPLHHSRRRGQGSRRRHVLSHPRKRRHADQLGLQSLPAT